MPQSLPRRIALALDRPGGRALLRTIAQLRWAPDRGVGVRYDEMWIDEVDGVYIPRSQRFVYGDWDFEHMRRFAKERLDGSIDYWTHVYKPTVGDTIIDVGAGVGIDAIALSPLIGPTGRIYALEAHPWTVKALRKTVALNRLSNVVPCDIALAEKPGTVYISDIDNDEGNTVSVAQGKGHDIAVRCTDLDSFVSENGINEIALLKMNIEGAEALAIKGMKASISKVRNIVVACHDFRDDLPGTKRPVLDFLLASGFNITERLDDHRQFVKDHVHGYRR